jgi:hypothetical protein
MDMNDAYTSGRPHSAIRDTSGEKAVTLAAADYICLAAAPTFVIMAVLTGAFGGISASMLCSGMADTSSVGGMAPMYLLMSAFHSTPWLRLISRRRNGIRGT